MTDTTTAVATEQAACPAYQPRWTAGCPRPTSKAFCVRTGPHYTHQDADGDIWTTAHVGAGRDA